MVDTERPELGEDGYLPCGCGNPGFRAPAGTRFGVQLGDPLRVPHPSVGPDPPAAAALQEAGKHVEATAVARSPTLCSRPPDVLDPSPEIVRDRWIEAPRCWPAILARATVSTDPAVVERVHQNHPDACGGKPCLRLKLRRAHAPERIPLEQADDDGHALGIDLEGVRRLRKAPEPEPRHGHPGRAPGRTWRHSPR